MVNFNKQISWNSLKYFTLLEEEEIQIEIPCLLIDESKANKILNEKLEKEKLKELNE